MYNLQYSNTNIQLLKISGKSFEDLTGDLMVNSAPAIRHCDGVILVKL